jgi:predicted AAA+ superfamily ATPase
MFEISETEINARLKFDNPWWLSISGTEERYKKLPKRFYFKPFFELLSEKEINRAVVLMGPRRVGKTVMVFHAIQELIDGGIPSRNILYLSLETPIYTGLALERIINLFILNFKHERSSELFIFFDEIQYLKDWEIHLKSLVDSYPTYKFVATGSAAAALRMKSKESGAGRFTDFLLPSLTFSEYLTFINRSEELILEKEDDEWGGYSAKNIEELNKEFINYLNYGGYPEAVFSEKIKTESSQFIKSDIIDKVLLRDLPSLYGIDDIQELNRLFTTVAYNTGQEVSLEELSMSSGVAKNTIKKYLEYLEAAFLIKKVTRVDETARKFKRATSFKVYLTNPSMRAALFGFIEADSQAMGALTETAIYSQWLHSDTINNLRYARWKKGEIDIVYIDPKDQKPLWVVEVKWSDAPIENHHLLENIIYFMDQHKIENTPLITTRTQSANIFYKEINFEMIPSSEYAFLLGKNILNLKWAKKMTLNKNDENQDVIKNEPKEPK